MPEQNKSIALVTGASRGIGRAIAIELAKEEYHIIINYRSNDDAANSVLKSIVEGGGSAELAKFDVADRKEAALQIDAIINKYPKIDVLINNAGINADTLFVMMNENEWDSVIDTTLKGFYNITKPVLKTMMKAKSGSIVNISSISGIIGNRGQANYSAAKAGLIGATKAIASEAARFRVRVNAVAPGLIETDMIQDAPIEEIKKMIPMNRIGQADEVAKLVKFLCSEDSSYITGQVISINGGMC